MKSRIATMPNSGIMPGSPSLKSIKMKDENTNAEPVSFCMMMMSMGKSMMPHTMA